MILVSNPGSASRKYAVFDGDECKLRLHFEHENDQIVCSTENDKSSKHDVEIGDLSEAASQLPDILRAHSVDDVNAIALRIVAPSAYFLQHRRLDGEAIDHLRALESRAPLHIAASLQELQMLQQTWPDKPVFGISDSAFHATKPDYAWNYGIKLEDADRFEIKRFGYHGLSAQSVVSQLADKLPARMVICHLGSGSSVMAVQNGQSVDATMGFSPLEGLVMSTRSGTIDITAVRALQDALELDDHAMRNYLNEQSGLFGLSGTSSDIRVLLQRESEGDHRAGLALKTYVHHIQQAVGQMAATLGGIDALVFTGTVGERAHLIRRRVVSNLHFLELELNQDKNYQTIEQLDTPQLISASKRRSIFVVPAKEEREMVSAVSSLLG